MEEEAEGVYEEEEGGYGGVEEEEAVVERRTAERRFVICGRRAVSNRNELIRGFYLFFVILLV